jgi:DNA-binding NtrC family response regulator
MAGTLFLDEIGDLPLDVQVKLLRAVQEGEVDPVGGRQTVKVDIKLISATHRDLMQQVKERQVPRGPFLSPQRLSDHDSAAQTEARRHPALVRTSSERAWRRRTARRRPDSLRRGAGLLEAYDWPGNIRQLENAVLRAVVLATATC